METVDEPSIEPVEEPANVLNPPLTHRREAHVAFTLAETVFAEQIPQQKDIIESGSKKKHRRLTMSELSQGVTVASFSCSCVLSFGSSLIILIATALKNLTSVSGCSVSSSVQRAAQQQKPQHV